MSPRVSVVVAAHDAASTLPDTLASVDAQSYGDWEIVVVDDGSSDETAEVARAFGERARVFRNDTARGPAAARNRGAREARGELLATLDADDVWTPGFLSSQLAVYERELARGRRVGVVCCDAELVATDGSPIGGHWSDRVGPLMGGDLAALLRENFVFTSVLCPRALFLELGGYDEDPRLVGVEDYDLWLRVAERGRAIVVNPAVLVRYRLGPGLSARVVETALGSRLVMERALERGALTPAERRVARKRRRVFGVVERRARIAAEPRRLPRALALSRALPLMALSALEHPDRWRHWLRGGLRSAGAARHTGA